MKTIRTRLLCSALFLILLGSMSCAAGSNLVLSTAFSDNMVLQQKTKAPIWGTANPGTVIQVTTTWSKMVYATTTTKNGRWKIVVNTPSYGGPYMMNIAGGNSITLKNIMVGEVWLCSGQSNMEMPLAGWGNIKNFKQETAAARYPNIRFLQADHVTSNIPSDNAQIAGGGWQVCSPESITGFSAVAYFFARELYKKTGIPIGLIHTSWGGTIAEAWTSGHTLKKMPDFAAAATKIEKTNDIKELADYNLKLKNYEKSLVLKDSGYAMGKPIWADKALNTAGWHKIDVPQYWERAGLQYFDGVVWLRKKITIPSEWAGKSITVNLGTIDDTDVTFFNGYKIGATTVFPQSRVYNIPANLVKAGEAVLTVRVLDTGGDGGIYGPKNVISLISGNGQKISLDGEWDYRPGANLKDVGQVPVLNTGPNRATVLYNAMIHPFIQYAIKGVIWYQGESNADRAVQYQELFPAMIRDWRAKWKIGNFPFYFVQLANFMNRQYEPLPSAWAELREAQRKTAALPNTGMAVTIDIGEAADIHPKNKQDVGKRLAMIALAKTYGYPVSYSGPVLSSYKILNNKIYAEFRFTEGGLKARGGNVLNGFTIAGPDNRFYEATALIQGNQVVLSAKEVPVPVAIRYAWANNPDCNLINGSGLPASPFRTDNWELSTFGKK
jgi:sialate O-acetylesterase